MKSGSKWSPSFFEARKMDWLQLANTALDKNPNVLTVAVTAFFLPVVILWLNNGRARKLKRAG